MAGRKQFTKYLFESPSVKKGEEPELKKSDFEFQKKLGDGAFGQVWSVLHKATGKLYATKQVPKEKVLKMLKQFEREVYIMYELNHPHIIKLYNHFEDERFFYLIMEHAEGGNLFHKLYRERQFLERVSAQYFREVCLAVEYLHSHMPPIIHRDIKPENILLDKNGRVKLTDFGWSNYYTDEEPRMTVCGTLEYLPPEIVGHVAHDTSADIWCLGVLLFEMLVGYTPFKANAKDRMLSNISKSKPKFPLSFPPLAKDLIMRMLTKDLKERIDIQGIKEHRWLLDHLPLRETITQDLDTIPLPNLDNGVPTIDKGYMVISSTQLKPLEDEIKVSLAETVIEDKISDSDFSLSSSDDDYQDAASGLLSIDGFEDDVYRESIKQIQIQINSQMSSIIQEKTETDQKQSILEQHNKYLKELEQKVYGKKTELKHYEAKEKLILSNISDRNIELEKLSCLADFQGFLNMMQEGKRKLMEKSTECTRDKKALENIKLDLNHKSSIVSEKEKEVKILTHELNKLKTSVKSTNQNKQNQISEMEINADVLKNRLLGSIRLSMEFEDTQVRSIHEYMNLLESRVIELEGLSEEDLLRKISKVNEKCHEIEMNVLEVNSYYRDKESEFKQKTKLEKETLRLTGKMLQKKTTESRKQTVDERINELRQELYEARETENIFLITESYYQEMRSNYEVILIQQLKQSRSTLFLAIQSLREARLNLRSKKLQKKREMTVLSKELESIKQHVS